jgi:heme oxygenase
MSITFTSDDDLLQLQTSADSANIIDIGRGKSRLRSSYRRVSVREALEQVKVMEEEGEEYEKNVTATSTAPADKIDRAYDATTSKGKPDGLFRACMEAIRSSHHEARQIRTALILVGLFTDRELYKEWLSVFYIVNLELEEKMKSADFEESLCNDESELTILKKLQELGNKYYFSELYEQDLQLLWGVSTREELLQKVDSCLANKPNASEYRSVIRNMTKASELSGALFCLWGVYIVGGGAMARQRALKMCGEDGVHVYKNVAGPGREKRKADFIELWDNLAENGTSEFQITEKSSDMCMKLMNATIKDLSANPWWLKWVSVSMLAVVGGSIAVAYSYLM